MMPSLDSGKFREVAHVEDFTSLLYGPRFYSIPHDMTHTRKAGYAVEFQNRVVQDEPYKYVGDERAYWGGGPSWLRCLSYLFFWYSPTIDSP